MKYSGMLLIGFLIIIIAIAGCIEPDKPLATQTPVPTSSAPAPTPAPSAIPVSPTVTATSPAGIFLRLHPSVPANSTNSSLTGPSPVSSISQKIIILETARNGKAWQQYTGSGSMIPTDGSVLMITGIITKPLLPAKSTSLFSYPWLTWAKIAPLSPSRVICIYSMTI